LDFIYRLLALKTAAGQADTGWAYRLLGMRRAANLRALDLHQALLLQKKSARA